MVRKSFSGILVRAVDSTCRLINMTGKVSTYEEQNVPLTVASLSLHIYAAILLLLNTLLCIPW